MKNIFRVPVLGALLLLCPFPAPAHSIVHDDDDRASRIEIVSVSTSAAANDNKSDKKTISDSHIVGHVIDAETREHIPYVSIGLKGTTMGTVSDMSGHYALRNIPVGRYTFVVSCAGYKNAELPVTVEADKTLELNVELAKELLKADEVVVTASRSRNNRRLAPTLVGVANKRLFESTASVTPADVLNFQSGMRMENNCSNCGVPQLRINGLEGQYSQILIDSRPILSSLANVYGLEQFPAAMIDRIEVVRGGGSALYGSSAVGGVVNIITKEPVRNSLEIANQSAIMQGGEPDITTSFGGSLVSEDNRAGAYVFGMVRDRHEYDRDGDSFSEIPKLNSQTLGFRGFYKTSAYSKLTAEYHHITEFRRGGDKFNLPPHEADVAEQLRHGINGGGLKFDLFSKDYRHRVNLFASAQGISRSSYFGTGQDLNAYGTTLDNTFVGGGQYLYAFNKLFFAPSELIVGAEYNYNNLWDRMLGYGRNMKQIVNTVGVYLQNEWKTEKFNLLVGARLDKNSQIDHAIVSPRVSGRYTPVQGVALRASYSSGYRAPQAYDEDLHVAAVGGEVAIIELDPELKPEYSHSVNGSVDLSKTVGNVQMSLLVEGFYTYLKDVFVLDENGNDPQGNLLLLRRNGAGARVAGVNLEGNLAVGDNLLFQLGYTWQRSRYTEPERWSENPNIEPQKRMFRSPDHYGFLNVDYNPLKDLKVSFSGIYTGSMLVQHFAGYIPEDRQYDTPSFFDLSLRLAYDFSLSRGVKMQVSGGVKNFLDAFQKDLDQGPLRDASYIYGPAVPRTYFIGLKFTI